MTDLAAASFAIADTLSEAHVRSIAAAAAGSDGYNAESAQRLRLAIPTAHRTAIEPLLGAWASSADVAGASVALALHTALVARRAAAACTVDVVVTGPDSPTAPVRLTSEVVRQLINSANKRVMLVSFSAYRVPTIINALNAAVARGVRVEVVLESVEQLEFGDGGAAYKKYRTYRWPVEQRIPPDAKLHAKAVIVDARDVLLTSANMSNSAYDTNIELGVLCRGGPTAKQVQQHFDALIARGVLRGT